MNRDELPTEVERPDDHDARMVEVRRYCQWHLGDRSWADTLVNIYLDPRSNQSSEVLAKLPIANRRVWRIQE